MKHIKPTILSLAVCTLAACSSSNSVLPKLDYQSENNKVISLEVPPDLNDPRQGDLYNLPQGTVAQPDALSQKAQAGSGVLAQVKNARIERSGNQRWLVVDNKQAAEMWPVLRAFWLDSGFTLSSEEPRIGLMETEWAENRAKLPNQGLRRLFDRIGIGSVYTTSERDKFLVRMEHNQNGGLDIFFTHKGLEEVYADRNKDSTVWQPRPNDPNLEAAMLARFMQYLGLDEAVIAQQIENQTAGKKGTEYAKLEVNNVLVYGAPERNVNRIGAALDRIGLSVQQFVPERSMFVVRPAPQETATAEEKPGFFGKLFGGKKKADAPAAEEAPQMFVFLEAAKETEQRIHLLDQFGKPYEGKDANRWLNELYKELR